MSQPQKPGKPNPPVERSGTLIEPAAGFAPREPAGQQPIERSGTLIETDDDIRQAFLSGQKGRQPGPAGRGRSPCPDPACAGGRRVRVRGPVSARRRGRRWRC